MTALTLTTVIQVIVGLGLLNVWLVRPANSTSYRGGTAQTLRGEFAAYHLPDSAFFVVGALKIVAGIVLLAALWWPMPGPVRTAAEVVAVLMIGAIVMHVRIKDPISKSVPAAVMLAMCAALVIRTWDR
jgi:hypothetical protein